MKNKYHKRRATHKPEPKQNLAPKYERERPKRRAEQIEKSVRTDEARAGQRERELKAATYNARILFLMGKYEADMLKRSCKHVRWNVTSLDYRRQGGWAEQNCLPREKVPSAAEREGAREGLGNMGSDRW